MTDLLLAAAAGGLITAAFLDFSLYPLAWIAFVPLLWALDRRPEADAYRGGLSRAKGAHGGETWNGAPSRRQALRLGLAAGLATNVPAFHWLVHTMQVFGGFPLAVAVFFYLCLSLYAAGQLVLFALAFRRLSFGPLGLAPPVLWVALEFLYPNLFPWRLANSQFHAPVLMQIGDVTGPFGLSFVMVWLASGMTLVLRRPRRPGALAAALASVVVVLGYGAIRWADIARAIERAPVVRVGLVQGNVGIREKGNAAFFEINLDKYRSLSVPLQDAAEVLIWPESVAHWWVATDAERLDAGENPFPALRRFLIFGGLAYANHGSREERYNSAFLIDSEARVIGRYDKQVLLPFGEYLPGASLFPSLAELSPQTGDFTPGRRSVTLDVPGRVRFAPLVCYEDVPAGIAREMTAGGAEALLTIFNDAWFGRSMAPYQHEALALWRAVENRRYFVRVGNAGATGVIDPFGRVVGRLGLFTEETLAAEIRPLGVETFYTRHGDVFGWLVVAVAAGWLLVAWHRGRTNKG